MAGLIDVAVLPKDVRTVDEALELLLELPQHAFVTTGGRPRLLHARDLLNARKKSIKLIGDARGRRLAKLPQNRRVAVGGPYDAIGDVRSVFVKGRADKVFGSVFFKSRSNYLLAGIGDTTATVLTRREDFEYELSQAACECDDPARHTRDGQRSDTGKNCAVPGCPGTYTCY